MKISYYEFLEQDLLQLFLSNGRQIFVRLDNNSGRIVWRFKIGSLFNVHHTGIWLGTDYDTGEIYIIHNHHQHGAAHIAGFSEFSAGKEVYWKKGECANSPSTVIAVGLDNVIAGKPYEAVTNNCQTLTNTACYNKPVSEDVNRLAGAAFGIFAIGLIISALTE